MEIKSYKKPGYISWSNSKAHSELLCCQRFQQSQNQLYAIDFLSIDIADRSKDLQNIGSCFFPRPFRCIAWDTFGQKQNTYSHGLLFGGMQDGSFTLWSPAQAIQNKHQYNLSTVNPQNYQVQPSLLYEEQPDQNGALPIMCAQWNSLKPNYLVFGSSQVLIIDVGRDIASPDIVKPGDKNPHVGGYITSVKWNKQVPHIFASASSDAVIALWDIKSKSSIFQFKGSSNTSSQEGKNVVICWSKNISTQIAVTLDDEKKNQLQIWDLRNQKGPVVVIDQGHSKGINAMDWCETDPQLIMTGGRDSQALCWNYTQPQAQPISQIQCQQDILQVKWSKKLPSIFSVSTTDAVSIYTLNQTNLFSYVPKWYKIPNGTSMFSNDVMLTYSESRGNILHQYKLNTHKKTLLAKALDRLNSTVNDQEIQRQDSDLWKLITAKKSKESQDQIFHFLNLDKQKIINQVQKYTGKKRQTVRTSKNQKDTSKKNKQNAFIPVSGEKAEFFFQNLNNQSLPSADHRQVNQYDQNIKMEMVPKNFNWDVGKQRLIKQNILIGNYDGAIDAALKCGRTAQALIIAHSVSIQTFNTTLKTFFTQTTDSFITDTLKPLANRDSEQLIKKYDIDKWKECIALVFTLTNSKRQNLLKMLANRIKEQTKDQNAITICLILAQDFEQISRIYFEQLNSKKNHSIQRKKSALQNAQKLIAIYQSLTTDVTFTKQYKKVIRQAAYVCVQQGRHQLAYDLMNKYSPNCKDAFMDYLTSLKGLQSNIYSKTFQLPVMKRPQKPRNQPNQNIRGNQQNYPQHQQQQAFNPQGGRPKPPQPLPGNRNNRQVPVQDNHQTNNNVPRPPPMKNSQPSQQNTHHVQNPPPMQHSNQNSSFSPYQEEQQHHQQSIQIKKPQRKAPPPPSGVKKNVPPSPLIKQTKTSDQQQSFIQETRSKQPQPVPHTINKPPPPTKKNIPTPPPKHQVHHQEKEEQSYQQQKFEQTPKNLPPPKPVKKTGPPPPPIQSKNYDQQPQQQYNNTQSYGNQNQQNWGSNQYTNQQGNFNQNQQQQQQYGQQNQWSNQQVPSPNSKSNYTHQTEPVQQQTKVIKKNPPPTPGKKNVPPPPKRG